MSSRRRPILWPSVVLVLGLVVGGAVFYALGEHTLGASLATFGIGLVTPLRLAGEREEDGGDATP